MVRYWLFQIDEKLINYMIVSLSTKKQLHNEKMINFYEIIEINLYTNYTVNIFIELWNHLLKNMLVYRLCSQ